MATSAELQKQADAQNAAKNAAALAQKQKMQQTQQQSSLGQQDYSHAKETDYKYLDPTLATKDKYNAQAEARRMESIKGLMGSFGSGGGAGGPGGGGGQIGFNEQGARDAAFARAKDRAGQTSRAAMDSLRGALASSGRLGGNFEAEKMAQVVGGAAGDLGEFERDQLMLDLNRAGQISDRNFQGDIVRRGQDLQRQAALLGLFNVSGAVY